MSRYRVLASVTQNLFEVFTTNLNGAASATQITVNNADGTVTVIGGTGLALSGSVATAGTITSITRQTSVGGTTLDVFDLPTTTLNLTTFWNAPNNLDRRTATLVSNDTITGSTGNDTLYGDGGNDTINGGDGNDVIYFGAGDSAIGGMGDDLFIVTNPVGSTLSDGGGAGNDTLDASQASSGVNFSNVYENFIGSAFNDSFVTNNLTDTANRILLGNAGHDTMDGAAGADSFNGGIGDDEFTGHAGNDTFNGGDGADIVFYSGETAVGAVFVNQSASSVTVGALTQAAGTGTDRAGNTDTYISVEGAGGTSGNDTLIGGETDDYLRGFAGNDSIRGNGGFDQLVFAGLNSGTPTNGITVTFSGGGDGTVNNDGFGGVDTFTSIERIRGTSFADSVTGDASDNSFRGLRGNDTFHGGGGNDEIAYDNDSNVTGGSGNVTVNLATGMGTDGFNNTDTFTDIENVSGSRVGNDTLTGSAVANRILGNGGNDFLAGMQGMDTIDGGDGANDMVNYANDSTAGGAGGVIVNLSAATVILGADTILSGTAKDGFGDIDTLLNIEEARGTAQADHFYGSIGYNWFQGRAGADSYFGGNAYNFYDSYPSDFNWVDYRQDGGAGGVTVNLATGIGTDTFGAAEAFTDITSIRASMQADNLTGNQYYNAFQGLQGNDIINGGGGYDRVEYNVEATYGGTAGVTVNLATGIAIDGFGNTDTLSNIEQVIGTGAADSITGNAWDNFIQTSGGNDTVRGGDGVDSFRVGLGADLVDGTAGAHGDQADDDRDTVQYNDLSQNVSGTGVTGVIVNLSNASITVNSVVVAGNTALDTGLSVDTLIDIERARGTNFNDFLRGSDTANFRQEGFEGRNGNDTIDGGAGYNVLRYDNDVGAGATMGIIANLSTSTIVVGGTTVVAGSVRDSFGATDTVSNISDVWAGSLADYVQGSAGRDIFRGRGGQDTFNGGAGEDVFSAYQDDLFYGIVGAGAVVNLTTGTATNFLDAFTTTLIDVEDVNGGERSDFITGNAISNRLFGSYGNDTIDGAAGNDILTGSYGNDSIIGGADIDYVSYLYDPTQLSGYNLQRADIFGALVGTGGATVDLTTGIATDGLGGTDTISGVENVTGTFFADSITGDAGANSFFGLSGNDTIDGGLGQDTVRFDIWGVTQLLTNSLLVGLNGSRPDGVNVNLTTGFANDAEGGTDTLTSIENVFGSLGNDVIIGSTATNHLQGRDGNDTLSGVGTVGDDTLDGGNGTDLADYSAETGAVNVRLDLTTVVASVTYNYASGAAIGFDLLRDIENVTGGSAGDYLYGNSLDNVLIGNDGGDVITADGGADTIQGGAGQDLITAGHGNDSVEGGTDGDIIYGTAGNDTLNGGDGNDQISGAFGSFNISGGAGNDTLYADAFAPATVSGGADIDYLIIQDVVGASFAASDIENWYGFTGNDVFNATGASTLIFMRGNGGNDLLTGGNAGDYLFGDADNDTLNGGDGFDILFGGAGADQLFGGNDTDLLYVDALDTVFNGGGGTDYLVLDDPGNVGVSLNIGSSSIEWVTGRGGNDTISAAGAANFVEMHGDNGNDRLTAGNLGSILLGEGGNDTLLGGSATDHMVGGIGGIDVFAFGINSGTDFVYDFDKASLDKIDFSALGLAGFGALTVNTAYSGANYYGYSSGGTTVWVLSSQGALTAGDFIF